MPTVAAPPVQAARSGKTNSRKYRFLIMNKQTAR